MEMEPGKLFIGGISWDTTEDRLKEYFQIFGKVMEAVIMKDRITGRARGFGFVVFSDPAVAEMVVKEKHTIDGRTVEAKKAVPRDDQQSLTRSNSSIQGSPGPTRTKKIFVGGLASSVTENDFKKYFENFGTITDVVVMYDHNTQRPRGFGFITYDSEESVDKVLLRTFHELNGKIVEVKRAVPKELSPSPKRSQLSEYKFSSSRIGGVPDGYFQGYSPSPIGVYGVRMDGRFSPINVGRTVYPPLSPTGYNVGLNFESTMGTNYNGNGNIDSNIGYGNALKLGQSMTSNWYSNTVGYGMANATSGSASYLNSTSRNLWGQENFNYATNSTNLNVLVGNGNSGLSGGFGGVGAIWRSSLVSDRSGGMSSGNINNGSGDGSLGFGVGGYGRNGGSSAAPPSSYVEKSELFDGDFGNCYASGSLFEDPTWRSSSPDLELPGFFGYSHKNGASDSMPKNSVGYVGYNGTTKSNRGIEA